MIQTRGVYMLKDFGEHMAQLTAPGEALIACFHRCRLEGRRNIL